MLSLKLANFFNFFCVFQGDKICVSSLQNANNSAEVEKYILNKYMEPKLLIKVKYF